jgi:hypothetical protein
MFRRNPERSKRIWFGLGVDHRSGHKPAICPLWPRTRFDSGREFNLIGAPSVPLSLVRLPPKSRSKWSMADGRPTAVARKQCERIKGYNV